MTKAYSGPGRTIPATDPTLTGVAIPVENSQGDVVFVSAAAIVQALAAIDTAALAAAGGGGSFALTQSQFLVSGSQYFASTGIALATLPSYTNTNTIGRPELRTIQIIAGAGATVTVKPPVGSTVEGTTSVTVAPGAFRAWSPNKNSNDWTRTG